MMPGIPATDVQVSRLAHHLATPRDESPDWPAYIRSFGHTAISKKEMSHA